MDQDLQVCSLLLPEWNSYSVWSQPSDVVCVGTPHHIDCVPVISVTITIVVDSVA